MSFDTEAWWRKARLEDIEIAKVKDRVLALPASKQFEIYLGVFSISLDDLKMRRTIRKMVDRIEAEIAASDKD